MYTKLALMLALALFPFSVSASDAGERGSPLGGVPLPKECTLPPSLLELGREAFYTRLSNIFAYDVWCQVFKSNDFPLTFTVIPNNHTSRCLIKNTSNGKAILVDANGVGALLLPLDVHDQLGLIKPRAKK